LYLYHCTTACLDCMPRARCGHREGAGIAAAARLPPTPNIAVPAPFSVKVWPAVIALALIVLEPVPVLMLTAAEAPVVTFSVLPPDATILPIRLLTVSRSGERKRAAGAKRGGATPSGSPSRC